MSPISLVLLVLSVLWVPWVPIACSADAAPAALAQQMRARIEADWVERDLRFGPATARPNKASAEADRHGVTTAQDAAGGCDGVKTGTLGFHTASGEIDPWWQVDLGKVHTLDRVVVFNRTDNNNARRTRKLRILVADTPGAKAFREVYRHTGKPFLGVKEKAPLVVSLRGRGVAARVVRLMVPGRCSFALDEVEVYPADAPRTNIALGRPADQKSVSPYSYPGTKGHGPRVKPAPPRPAAPRVPTFSLAHTRAVIGRAKALAARLRPHADAARLGPLVASLAPLDRRLAALEHKGDVSKAARRAIYLDARRLARRIAFCNPLLDIDRLLFIKRHDPGGLYHMVHQYYGFGAKPGGGLFVLHDPFGPSPRLVNVLESSVAERGRLKGRKLVPGAVLSPEVSFDGKTILFAYTEAKAKGVEWSPRASFHIFRVNADGSGLVQLTDGTWNDFDPCFLPNGRVVFISGRRGGYLRCGGSSPPYHSPTYTLHSMEPDGSDIICLSYHETQEWHPSVTHDGMVAYTRWDYVDRDTNVAHHIWLCYPDGRNPRAYHGNYPVRRESRPWMEMSIRAVPGSHKFVATAAAHHGHAYGSLVLIDQRLPDDGAMSQVERITPDVALPEAEGGKRAVRRHMAYGTPWPLSEDDYLCVYGHEGTNRGIYWVDRFGNRELVYRDPAIHCLSPIPLRPRPRPPAVPEATSQTATARRAAGGGDATATVSVMNVYDSDFEWPAGTTVTALRVIQVLPKTTPRVNTPRIGIANGTNARAVLGTVPVAADGSAHFEAPAGRLLYFQALGPRGMAVQSMRSGTYLHPGEHLSCQGCHERKHTPPGRAIAAPMAMRRAPSKIQPEPDGSNPFSYPRLVQPVLDRHCVACHREKKALDVSGAPDGPHGWSRSYHSLARKYGFWFAASNGSIRAGVHGGSRTIAGKFGARASRLLHYLDARHYGVKLPPGDFRRLALWLDCNSEFYGVYENTAAQARGEVVRPSLH